MRHPFIVCFLAFILLHHCGQELQEARINGILLNPIDTKIRIGQNTITFPEDGRFNFATKLQRPSFIDMVYGELEWSIYLEPGSEVNFSLSGDDLSSVTYRGELIPSNMVLANTTDVGNEINRFLNTNWIRIHRLDESAYITVIDSLKQLYLRPLQDLKNKTPNVSETFIKLFNAEVNFSLDRFIVQYFPENHFVFAGSYPRLGQATLDYIDAAGIDVPSLTELPSYERFCKAWIDFKVDRIAAESTASRHYNLKKMDAVFQVLPELFQNPSLRDFWLSEYLTEHIDKNGISNSDRFIDTFASSCRTKKYRDRIKKLHLAEIRKREGHDVEIFKTVDEFKLEAHIFKPEHLKRSEKRPAIVIFHGGGWGEGNASWAFGRARHFQEMGLVAVAAQYRLTNKKDITALESMADARDLILWVRSNAESMNIAAERVAAFGWSAGAHLASSAAIFPDSIAAQGIDSTPDALILESPAVSLPKGEGWELWNYSVFGFEADVSRANPVEHIRSGLPPTIILQGREDTVTPLIGVQTFHERMIAKGNTCELHIYDGVGHLFTPSHLNDKGVPIPDREIQAKAYGRADEFLMKLGYINQKSQ